LRQSETATEQFFYPMLKPERNLKRWKVYGRDNKVWHFSSNRRWLATANRDRTIKLWDLQTGQSIPPLRGHTGQLTAIAFHSDNQRVISASLDGSVKVWDISTGKILNSFQDHTDTIGALAVGEKGKLLVSGSKDKTAKLRDLDAQTQIPLVGPYRRSNCSRNQSGRTICRYRQR
jgi:WD40 repeat protein